MRWKVSSARIAQGLGHTSGLAETWTRPPTGNASSSMHRGSEAAKSDSDLARSVTDDRAFGASFTCYSKCDNCNEYGSGASSDYDPREWTLGPSVSSLQFLLGNRAMPCALLPCRRIVREPIVVHSPKVVQTFAYPIDAIGPLYAHAITLLRRLLVSSA